MSQSPYTLCIDHIPGETRAALLQNDRLVELQIDRCGFSAHHEVAEGNIYLGRVVNVVPSLQAAFIDIGSGKNGFLPVNATYEDDISKAVHQGQAVTIQVRKVGQDDKGPLLSCKLDLTGAHCVLTPNRPGINISRKIADDSVRARLKSALSDAIPEECGLIVRTSAETVSDDILKADLQKQVSIWHTINGTSAKAPALLKDSTPFLERIWQAYSSLNLETVYVDGVEALQMLQNSGAPAIAKDDLFETFALDEEIEKAVETSIPLPNGGNIHIERTSALIAIDVNMGDRLDSRNTEDNKLRTNLDVLEVLKDQIVLRNLSGQILVDFISLKSQSHKDRLRDAVKNKLSGDPRLTVHGFTRLGLCEITRTRQGHALDELYHAPSSELFRLIRLLAKGGSGKQVALAPAMYSTWISPSNRPSLVWLYDKLGYQVKAVEDKNLSRYSCRIEES